MVPLDELKIPKTARSDAEQIVVVTDALCQINFLFDAQQSLHVSAGQLSELVGVKKTTMANKANQIRRLASR